MIALAIFPMSPPRAEEKALPSAQEGLRAKRLWYGTVDVDTMEWGTLMFPTSNLVTDVAVFPDGGMAGLLTMQQKRYGRVVWDTVRIVRIDRRGRLLWDRSYEATDRWDVNHWGGAVAAMPDGGLTVGGASSSYGAKDFWVMRLDAAGGPMWRARFSGKGETEPPSDMAAFPDGGILVATDDWYGDENAYDAWILRLDRDGRVLWETRIDWGHRNRVYRLLALADGRSTAVIFAEDRGDAYSGEMWAVGLDRAGKVQWRRRFEGGSVPSPTTDGGVLSCGSASDPNTVGDPMLIERFDSAGRLLWRRRAQPRPPVPREKLEKFFAGRCIELSSGEIAFGAEYKYLSPSGVGTVRELWLGRLDSAARALWLRRVELPGPATSYYLETSLEPAPDGSIIVYGTKLSGDGRPGKSLRHHLWIDRVLAE